MKRHKFYFQMKFGLSTKSYVNREACFFFLAAHLVKQFLKFIK